ncbi:MAG TPA: HD domain-containing phosphohydrolase, partial [Geobacteraceae bacterium]
MPHEESILTPAQRLTRLADVDAVLQGLARQLKREGTCRWIAVYLFDREQRDIAPVLAYGLPSRYFAFFRHLPLQPDRVRLLKTLLRKRKYVLFTSTSNADYLPVELRGILTTLSIHALPMMVHNQLIGVVFIARGANTPPLSPEKVAAIRELISHAALVVSHIRLFDESLDMSVEVAKRIDVILSLDEINKAISSSLSPAKIIDTAMESIERVVHSDLAAILVEEKEGLTVTACRAEEVAIPEALRPGSTLRRRSLAVAAYESGQSRYIADLGSRKRLPLLDRKLAEAGIASHLATPLISKERTKGVLLLGDTRRGKFVREDAFTIEKIAAQMAVALENARLYEEMRALFIGTVASLANAIDAKSPWTKGHSERVMHYAAAIAQEMGLPEETVEKVRLGGLLHDIGKIGVIEALLEKPALLADDEFPPMRLHPEKGVAILAPIEQLKGVLPGILHHHERYDGSGYPDGLKGEEI